MTVAVVFTMSSVITVNAETSSEILQYNDYLYYKKIDEDDNGIFDYVECSGSVASGTIEIPSEIDGLPVKELGTFIKCENLVSVKIPDSVTRIGNYAFANECNSLESIDISEYVTEIGNYAFTGCPSLKSINVAENNPNYCDVDGVLFNKNMSKLIQYPAASDVEKYVIPETVTSMSDMPFSYCSNLKEVTVSKGMSFVSRMNFAECYSLEKIVLHDMIISIGDYAFQNCQNLKSITIPEKVTEIRMGAFSHCESLENIVIPKNVKSIGNSAFQYCKSLKNITILNSECEIYDSNTTISAGYHIGMADKDSAITGYDGSTAKAYAEKYGLDFIQLNGEESVEYDVNSDGLFNIADVVMLQKWLVKSGEIINWKAGDCNNDNVLNVFDLCIIKRKLIMNK